MKYSIKLNVIFTIIMTIRSPEQRQWRRSGVFNANFEQITHISLMFP